MNKDQAGTWGLGLCILTVFWPTLCILWGGSFFVVLCVWVPAVTAQLACLAVQMGARPWSVGRRKS